MTEIESIPEASQAATRPAKSGRSHQNPCNNGALRIATRHMGQLFDDVIEPGGLRATQYGLLSYINEMRGPTIKELATILVMDLSALGHTLKPLTRDGYIELVPDERDKRAKRIRLTETGHSKLEEARALWRVAQSKVETVLGPEKALAMRDLLALIASEEFAEAFRDGRPLR